MERVIEFVVANIFWVSLWVAIFLLLMWNLFGSVMSGVTQLEPVEATRMMNHEHATVIDIRKNDVFQQGHILNAINIPEGEIAEKMQELDRYRKKPLIVCCQNGAASPRIARMLKTDDQSRVYILKGGLMAWKNANLPLPRDAG